MISRHHTQTTPYTPRDKGRTSRTLHQALSPDLHSAIRLQKNNAEGRYRTLNCRYYD